MITHKLTRNFTVSVAWPRKYFELRAELSGRELNETKTVTEEHRETEERLGTVTLNLTSGTLVLYTKYPLHLINISANSFQNTHVCLTH